MTPAALAEREDELCEALIGVCQAIADAQVVWERCLGCGWLADPDQPCPTCVGIRRELAALRAENRAQQGETDA